MPGKVIQYTDFFSPEFLDKSLEALGKVQKEINETAKIHEDSITKMDKVNKKNLKTLNETQRKTKELTTQQKRTQEAEKEAKRIKDQLIKTQEKINIANSSDNKLLQKKREELRRTNKEIGVQKNSIRALQLETSKLIKQRANLNLQSAKGRKQFQSLTNSIKKNQDQLKSYDEQIGNNQRNVGNYNSALQGLAGTFGVALGGAALIAGIRRLTKETINAAKETTKISRTFDVSREHAQGLRSEILALTNTYGKEFTDVLESANILSKEFGITSDNALGLITEGFEKGADLNGRFLEILKQYPAQLKTVGLNAKQSIAILTETERAGVFSDKGIDAIKEAGIRLREMTPATQAALNAIGLSAEGLQKELTDGTKSLFDVIQEVSLKLGELPPESKEVGQAIADIFAGPGEDAGIRFLQTLGGINTDLDNIDSNLSDVEKTQRDLNKAWADFKTGIITGGGTIGKVIAAINRLLAKVLTSFRRLGMAQEDFARELTFDEAKKQVNEFIQTLDVSNKEQIESNNKLIESYKETLNNLDKSSQAYKDLSIAISDLQKRNETLSKNEKLTNEQKKETIEQEILYNKGLLKELEAKEKLTKQETGFIGLYKNKIMLLREELNLLDQINEKSTDTTTNRTTTVRTRTEMKGIDTGVPDINLPTVSITPDLSIFEEFKDEIKSLSDEADKAMDSVLKMLEPRKFVMPETSGRGGLLSRILGSKTEQDRVMQQLQIFQTEFLNFMTTLNQAKMQQIQQDIQLSEQRLSVLASELEKEKELKEKGLANNVEKKQQEIKAEEQIRKQALEQQKQAQLQQLNIDTINQASSLVTASANILQGYSTIPIIGWVLGIGAIASMLGAYFKQRANIKKQTQTFGEGGWIEGEDHDRGGVDINAEGGEFVTRKKSAKKSKKILELINEGVINDSYLYNIQGGKYKDDTVLTWKEIMKMTDKLEENNKLTKEQLNYFRREKQEIHHDPVNNVLIIKKGNTTDRIRLN